MLNDDLIKILQKYKKNLDDKTEIATVRELLYRIKNDPDLFIRKKVPGKIDVGASILLLSQDKKRGLFLFHKKIKKWTMPGGHADGEKNLYKVALEELKEEVGITLNQKLITMPNFIYKFDYPSNVFGYKKSIINLFYIQICPVGQIPKIMEPDKCEELRWFSLDEIKKITKEDGYQSISRLVKMWEMLIE